MGGGRRALLSIPDDLCYPLLMHVTLDRVTCKHQHGHQIPNAHDDFKTFLKSYNLWRSHSVLYVTVITCYECCDEMQYRDL